MRLVSNLVSLVSMLLLLGVIVLTGGATAMGLGWVLSKLFPVTVFEGSLIIAAVGIILSIHVSSTEMQSVLQQIKSSLAPPLWDWDDGEEDEEDWDEEADENGNGFDVEQEAPFSDPISVRRNAPCPCGSGRKYKNCCGRNKI
jgi:preprotein translocase subunit SecA